MAWPILTSMKNALRRKPKEDQFPDMLMADWASLAEALKGYSDPSYTLSRTAYQTMRRSDVVLQPMTKFAQRIGGMELTVVGSGKRRDRLQEIVDQTIAYGDALEWLAWAKVEGVRFLWHKAVWDEEQGIWVGDFRGCGRVKWKAAGPGYTPWYWTGWQDNRIGKLQESSVTGNSDGTETPDAAWYPRERATVFRPGAGDNPEGETELTVQIFLLAEAAQLLDKAMRVYSERYSVPREILKKMIDMLRPDEMNSVMQSAVGKMKLANARQRMTTSSADIVELLEPKGTTWGFLTEYRRILEGRTHKIITGELQSSGGAGEAGDRGGHDISEKQLNSAAVTFGGKIAEALTMDWLPWIEQINDHDLPRLKADEPRPYLRLLPPKEKQRLTVAELVQVMDRDVELWTDDIYETIGLRRPDGIKDTFKVSRDGKPAGVPGQMPSNTGDSVQRTDREQDDSNIPADNTRKQNPQEDLRNVGSDN